MPPDRDLDRELRDLGPHVEYPPVPDLARSVRGRLEGESTGSPARTRPQVWWIAAAAILLLVAVPVVSLAVHGTGGGASSGAGGGVAMESGGAAGPTRLVEEDESLAAGAGGSPSSMAAESGPSTAGAMAEGACGFPSPTLEARPARGAPGDGFGIRGRHFVAGIRGCNETGSGSPAAQTVPARDVRVEFLQGGERWKLGDVEADRGSRIAAELEVPTDARPGRATVRATYGEGSHQSPNGRTSAEARFFVTE